MIIKIHAFIVCPILISECVVILLLWLDNDDYGLSNSLSKRVENSKSKRNSPNKKKMKY